METAQLYVRDVVATVFRPEKELKGFVKVSLEPGEARTIAFDLDRRAFAFYDTVSGDWQVEGGDFEILIGASSRDIRLAAAVAVASKREVVVDSAQLRRLQPYYTPASDFPIDRQAFEALCGRTIPGNEVARGEDYTLNTPLGDMRQTLLGRLLYYAIRRKIDKTANDETQISIMARHFAEEVPLRGMMMVSGGKVTSGMLEGLLMVLNGRFLHGFARLFTELRRKEDSFQLLLKLSGLAALSPKNRVASRSR
jgi:beta-glucosidase